MTFEELKQEHESLKTQYAELLNAAKETANELVDAKKELSDINNGRVFKLPTTLTPNQYTAILNYVKEQRKVLQKAAKNHLPKEL
jgi:thioredoxin-related protein